MNMSRTVRRKNLEERKRVRPGRSQISLRVHCVSRGTRETETANELSPTESAKGVLSVPLRGRTVNVYTGIRSLPQSPHAGQE